MWSVEFWMGAVWTLICILVGGLIVLVLLAVLGDRPIPGYPKDPPPDEDDGDGWDGLGVLDDDAKIDAWLKEHVIADPPEANLLVSTDADAAFGWYPGSTDGIGIDVQDGRVFVDGREVKPYSPAGFHRTYRHTVTDGNGGVIAAWDDTYPPANVLRFDPESMTWPSS